MLYEIVSQYSCCNILVAKNKLKMGWWITQNAAKRWCRSRTKKWWQYLVTWKTVVTWTRTDKVKWQGRISLGWADKRGSGNSLWEALFQVVLLWRRSWVWITSGGVMRSRVYFFTLSLRWQLWQNVFMWMEMTQLKESWCKRKGTTQRPAFLRGLDGTQTKQRGCHR